MILWPTLVMLGLGALGAYLIWRSWGGPGDDEGGG